MADNEKTEAIDSEIKEGEVVEYFEKSADSNSGQKGPKIKRGRYDSLVLYEISEAELNIIERGSPSSTYLNFSIFLLSIAFSFLATLLTFEFNEELNRQYTIFVVITVAGLIIGLFLLILWFNTKNQFDEVLEKIKSRIVE